MNTTRVLAPAKINKTLKITGVREDGYHIIDSIMVPITLHDIMIVEKRDSGFLLTGNDPDLLTDDNYITKAHTLMEELSGRELPARVHLIKKIPVGGGLAGGTTDGAHMIHALNALYELGFLQEELEREALALGADFPFCLRMTTCKVTGIGEELEEIQGSPGEKLLIIYPDFPLVTQEVYGYYDEEPADHSSNDLLPGVLRHHPELKQVTEAIERTDPREYSMTGSGPSFFAVYETEEEREEAAKALEEQGTIIPCETL